MPKQPFFWVTSVLIILSFFTAWSPGLWIRSYAQGSPITDPVPGTIPDSGMKLRLTPLIKLPSSSSSAPKARVNFVTHANDGSGRLFTNDMRGYLYVLKNGAISLYLDLKSKFPDFVDTPGLGTGFAFFAFHPEFAMNGKFYTIHSEAGRALADRTPDYAPQGAIRFHGVLVEWTTANPAADQFAAGTYWELLRIGFPSQFHNLQQISFHPTAQPGNLEYGLLYISLGDGEEQSPQTWTDAAQNLGRPYGKILRIDPSGRNSPNGRYGIPTDNPFVGQAGKLGEIWAYGFRNPHRFSWDTGGTGKMILGHIGEKNIESVVLGNKGANYGWNEREGEFLFQKSDSTHVYPLPANDADFGYTYPVAMYDHDEGRSIVGGFVYRGATITALQGKYIFGDIVNGRIFYSDESAMTEQAMGVGHNAPVRELKLVDGSGAEVTLLGLLAPSTRVDLRFGIDAGGELYVSSKQNGQIWQLVPIATSATATPTPTATGRPTAVERSTGTMTPTPTVSGDVTATPPTPDVTPLATPTPSSTATVPFTPTVSITPTPTRDGTISDANAGYLPLIVR
jgi:hypothetical protein